MQQADGVGNAIGHLSHGKAPIETEAVATEITPCVLLKADGMEGTA